MPSTLFRVHFDDGSHLNVPAETPTAAREAAKRSRPAGIITKIKVVKGD